MNSKYKVGQTINVMDKYGDIVKGHIVLILHPFEADKRVYYCSMYPGALPDYEYVEVVDLNCISMDNSGRVSKFHALNLFKEDELELEVDGDIVEGIVECIIN